MLLSVLLPVAGTGCPAQMGGVTRPRVPQSAAVSTSRLEPQPQAPGAIVRVSYQEASSTENGHANAPKEKITLPVAIQLCILNNFRLRASAEKIKQAEAELVTASLIPNATLSADCQLIPLQRANLDNQLGPPQADATFTIPIDWLLFGKRVANMQAAHLGISVTNADFADLHRVQVGQTVDTFYEILVNEQYLKLAEESLAELEQIEKVTEELAKQKKVGSIELDRAKLAVLEAVLEKHDRERAFEVSKAKLRPLIGRTPSDPDFEAVGTLVITAVVPPPKLTEAVALAEMHRADLVSDRFEIARAEAQVEVERRKAKPQVSFLPGYTYQIQRPINGFPNGSLLDVGVSTTLPFTDRNQGNILKARAREIELRHTYLGNRADVLAEVETAVLNYEDAVEHLSQFNSPVTLKAAQDLRKNVEAEFLAGKRSLLELLVAHQAYRSRLSHVVEFQSDYWRNLNKLNMAVGLNAYDPEHGATQRLDAKHAEKK